MSWHQFSNIRHKCEHRNITILSVKHSKLNESIAKLQVIGFLLKTKQKFSYQSILRNFILFTPDFNRRYEISKYPKLPIHNVNNCVNDSRMNWTFFFFIHFSLTRHSPFLLNETSSLICFALPCLACMCIFTFKIEFMCTDVFMCMRETCSKYTTYLARA